MMTSGGKRKPAKPDLGAGTRAGRGRISPACPSWWSADATVPADPLASDHSPPSAHRHERTPSRTPTDPSHRLRRPTTITLGPGRLKYAVQPLKREGQRQGVASLEDSNGCSKIAITGGLAFEV